MLALIAERGEIEAEEAKRAVEGRRARGRVAREAGAAGADVPSGAAVGRGEGACRTCAC